MCFPFRVVRAATEDAGFRQVTGRRRDLGTLTRKGPLSRHCDPKSSASAPTASATSQPTHSWLLADHPDRRADQPGGDVVDGVAVEDLVGLLGDIAEVRGEDGAAHLAQRMVLGQRLLVEDVEAGS